MPTQRLQFNEDGSVEHGGVAMEPYHTDMLLDDYIYYVPTEHSNHIF